jgi:hypothetical protein
MVFIVKEKVENRVADPTKNNPYLTQKAEKKRDLCTCTLAKNITLLTCKKFPEISRRGAVVLQCRK